MADTLLIKNGEARLAGSPAARVQLEAEGFAVPEDSSTLESLTPAEVEAFMAESEWTAEELAELDE